jgi:hypothetical protein
MAAVGRLTLPSRKVSGSPVYKHIEFVRNAETLWAKIESHWHWLGVHPNEQFRRLTVGGVPD